MANKSKLEETYLITNYKNEPFKNFYNVEDNLLNSTVNVCLEKEHAIPFKREKNLKLERKVCNLKYFIVGVNFFQSSPSYEMYRKPT